MSKSPATEVLSVRLPAAQLAQIKVDAAKRGITVSEIARESMSAALRDRLKLEPNQTVTEHTTADGFRYHHVHTVQPAVPAKAVAAKRPPAPVVPAPPKRLPAPAKPAARPAPARPAAVAPAVRIDSDPEPTGFQEHRAWARRRANAAAEAKSRDVDSEGLNAHERDARAKLKDPEARARFTTLARDARAKRRADRTGR